MKLLGVRNPVACKLGRKPANKKTRLNGRTLLAAQHPPTLQNLHTCRLDRACNLIAFLYNTMEAHQC